MKRPTVAAALFLALILSGNINQAHGSVTNTTLSTNNRLTPRLVLLAKQYTGLHERKNRVALKQAIGVDPAKTPWCAAFLNKMLAKQGIKGTNSNQASSFLRWGKRTSAPKKGDIAVMRGHVGIFMGYSKDGKSVLVLGGNQNNSVKVTAYPRKRVIAYRTI